MEAGKETMDDNGNEQYQSVFTAWSDRLERLFVRGIAVLVVLLIVSQLVLQFPAARHWLTTTDESEGIPFHDIAH
ncbi:hypothetical protein [Cohnella herbarum]|uniref:Uncharacterized protein n=1 Tax=Cohnella herbarum TaxID=2728023 RepID=A0A7Z2VG30_9BACL|nr:hypothetical protein [Cohnella herbarum]QJD82396.1 hypothetical protein HH215_03810 [Cohnella herbarum]